LRTLDPGLGAPLSSERDWPYGSRQPCTPEHVVCSALLRFEEAEQAELEAQGALAPDLRGLRIDRTYEGTRRVYPWNGESAGEALLGQEGGPETSELDSLLAERFPRFLFAEHDSLLPGSLSGDVLADPIPGSEELGVAALSRLLQQAGLTPAELREGVSSRRLFAAEQALRDRLATRSLCAGLSLQSDRGRLVVHVEHGGVAVPSERLPRRRRYQLTLELRIVDALENSKRHVMLLLDGPARSFRRDERALMRRMLDDYVSRGLGVIYTSRLPFQVELQHSEQVLVLAPSREGAMVEAGLHDPARTLSVRAALGMTGRTSFTVNDLNLVVEGTSDARILRTLDELLRGCEEAGLPEDLTLTSAQGAEEVAAVSTFLARQGLGVIALFDSDSAGLKGSQHLLESARERPYMERLEVLHLGPAAGLDLETAAIEDLFPEEFYMRVARSVCGRETERLVSRVSDLSDGNPAARLSRAFEASGRRFPKGRVMHQLEAKLEAVETLEDLPPGMLERVRHLMESIRVAADRLRSQNHDAENGSPS
jgi:hypothetical protein